MTPKDIYVGTATSALAGYQLLEEQLKEYLDMYYGIIRTLLNGRVFFDFSRDDINKAPLGRLLHLFSKTCANKELIARVRALVGHRDEMAHQAFLCLYQPGTKDEDYIALSKKTSERSSEIANVMRDVIAEMVVVNEALTTTISEILQ